MVNTPHINEPDSKTMEQRYQRAQSLMQGIWTNDIAFNDTLCPFWIGDSDCFWYMRTTKSADNFGSEYRLVDAKKLTNQPAFDHQVLAAILAENVQQEVDANNLPISQVIIECNTPIQTDLSKITVSFSAFNQNWKFNCEDKTCEKIDIYPKNREISPDGKYAIFTRDFNLWLHNIETDEESALTNDGEENYAYGHPGSGWGMEAVPHVQARWSADSKRIFTVQHDIRQVKALPIMNHIPKDGIRPTVEYRKIAFPGDIQIPTLRLLCIEIETGYIQDANYRQIPVTRNSLGFFSSQLGWWASDNKHAYFVDIERDYKTVRVVKLNTYTGEVSVLLKETTDTQISLMHNSDELPCFVPIPESNELLWFSERSGWAHLYLYDLDTGDLKNTVTQGDWVVRQVVHLDNTRREAFIQTSGRIPERDPYYRDLCRVNLDTGKIETLASSNHEIFTVTYKDFNVYYNMLGSPHDLTRSNGISPTGNFCVVTQSRANEVPHSFLIDRKGESILELETADISALPDNWHWPEPVKLLSADSVTDIYGLVFRPSDFSPDNSYPIITQASVASPDFAAVSKGSFGNGITGGSFYLEGAALAELGFIVIQIDTRGTPFRSKAIRNESYGWLESACNFDDLISSTRQLAEQYSYMDLNRVGIISSVGGPGGLQGLLQHPDFYKVGISNQLHDSRLMSASMWGEMFEGISGPGEEYKYPEEMVENLRGKLLLINGMLDVMTPPAGIFRVVEALKKANKDFDLLLLPNIGHSFSSYIVRRMWDYLVSHLLEVEPPKEFKLDIPVYGE